MACNSMKYSISFFVFKLQISYDIEHKIWNCTKQSVK